jgi:hypothetical protein
LPAIAFLALTLTAVCVSPARADEPSPWHADIDVAYGRAETAYVSIPVPEEMCPSATCAPAPVTEPSLRLAIGAGHAGFGLEAGVSAPTSSRGGTPATGFAGLRADTAWDAPLSVFFRFAYVRRLGGVDGEGGRAGIGITLRPLVGLALYAEAFADATSVPSSMNDVGTLFAWSTFLGGGARFSFGH